jgi:hypothetical protein
MQTRVLQFTDIKAREMQQKKADKGHALLCDQKERMYSKKRICYKKGYRRKPTKRS